MAAEEYRQKGIIGANLFNTGCDILPDLLGIGRIAARSFRKAVPSDIGRVDYDVECSLQAVADVLITRPAVGAAAVEEQKCCAGNGRSIAPIA